MKKLFIFGDVHSFYNELKTALDEAGFDKENKDHCLISLGDLLDRGPDAIKVLNLVNSLPNNRKVCIIGNHELLMLDMISRGHPDGLDERNGTLGTLEQLTNFYAGHYEVAIMDLQSLPIWTKYRASLQWYFELDNYIFVHGWIPYIYRDGLGLPIKPEYLNDWRNCSAHKWSDATWQNGMEAWANGIVEPNKKIFAGHWHTSYAWSNFENYGVEFVKPIETYHYSEKYGREYPFACYDIYEKDDCCFLDGCVVVSHKVNVKVIEITDEEWLKYAKT